MIVFVRKIVSVWSYKYNTIENGVCQMYLYEILMNMSLRDFFLFRLSVVIPRTYYLKLQLKFVSEESLHSPVSAVRDVCGYHTVLAPEVTLCYNK